MMNRVNGAQGVKLLECTNPVKGKWRVRWDVHNNEDGSADYMEAEFNGKPSEETIKTMVSEWFNDRTNETILSGFVWNGMSVWLSNENQFNYKVAYGYKSLTNNGKKKEIIDREIPVQVASSQTGRRTFIPVFLTAVWTAVMSTSSCNSTSCRKHPPK